ncbi:O-methyltransferase [Apiospora arundinis]
MAHQTTADQQAPDIVSLARDVLRQTEEITEYLKANDFPALLLASGSSSVPPETVQYQDLYTGLKTSLEDLLLLVDGPKRLWRRFTGLTGGLGRSPSSTGLWLLHPGVHVELVGRIVRHLITHGIFAEHQAGLISHTPYSLIMQDDDFRSIVYLWINENLKAAVDTSDFLRSYPDQQLNSSHNSFVFHHGSGLYEYHAKTPERSERFAKAMAGLRTSECGNKKPSTIIGPPL